MTRTIGRSRWRALAVVAAVTLLAACGSSGGSSANDSGSTTTKAATTLPKVTIEAADFSFTAPATMPSGYVDVTVKNTGKEGHQVQFVKLGDGVTYDQFKTAASTTDIAALGTSTFVGGPNGADPGESTSAIIKLDPGEYALACFIPGSDGQPHAAHGMTATVKVEKTGDSVETAPATKGTITLGDFVFEPPADFNGNGMYEVTNKGNEVHELALFKIADGKTLDDVKGFILTPPGTPPPAGPPPFTEVGGTVGLSPGQSAWLDLELAAGQYAMFCFFPDPSKGNEPHALEGMIKAFTVTA
jgi:uncharacterized cupredoxin-like copper-binding protein